MEQITGKLVRGSETVSDNVSGRLSIGFSPTQEQRWSGYFNLPAGVTVNVGDVCELVLTDGRSGRIKLERVNVTTQGTFVSFGTD